jgi:hypothetical protein
VEKRSFLHPPVTFSKKKKDLKFSSITGNNLDAIGKRNLVGGAGNNKHLSWSSLNQ